MLVVVAVLEDDRLAVADLVPVLLAVLVFVAVFDGVWLGVTDFVPD